MPDQEKQQSDSLLGGIVRNRFSQASLDVLFHARREFSIHPATSLEAEYVVIGVLRVDPSVIGAYLTADWTTDRLEESLDLPPKQDASVLPEHVEVPLSAAVAALVQSAVLEADRLGNAYVQPHHLLLGLLDGKSERVAKILREAGIRREPVVNFLQQQR